MKKIIQPTVAAKFIAEVTAVIVTGSFAVCRTCSHRRSGWSCNLKNKIDSKEIKVNTLTAEVLVAVVAVVMETAVVVAVADPASGMQARLWAL